MKPTDIIDVRKLRDLFVHPRQQFKEEQDTAALDLSNIAVETQQEEGARPINPLALQGRIARYPFEVVKNVKQ